MAKTTINDVAPAAGGIENTVRQGNQPAPLPDSQPRVLAMRRDAPAPIDRKLIALIHDASADPFLTEIQRGIAKALRGSGYDLLQLRLDTPPSSAELRKFLERQSPTGAILLPPLSENEAVVRLCRSVACDHVRLGASALDEPAHLVTSEDRGAAAMAVGYLISFGHQRIGFVSGPEESRVAQERELGYLDAMADHDLDRGPALIANGDFTFESGQAAGQLLLEVSPRPTAIFAGNDEMAAGVIHAAARKGIKVPEALSIIGFEDAPIASHIWPPLTTVRVPLMEMARAAALKLVKPEVSAHKLAKFKPQLVPRATVAAAPRQS